MCSYNEQIHGSPAIDPLFMIKPPASDAPIADARDAASSEDAWRTAALLDDSRRIRGQRAVGFRPFRAQLYNFPNVGLSQLR